MHGVLSTRACELLIKLVIAELWQLLYFQEYYFHRYCEPEPQFGSMNHPNVKGDYEVTHDSVSDCPWLW